MIKSAIKCTIAKWWLDWLMGDLCYLCHSICTQKLVFSRRDVRNEPAFSESLWFPLEETEGRWGLGWKLQGLLNLMYLAPHLSYSFLVLFIVVWTGCLGGTWEYAGRTNVLGCNVPHVCEISLSWTYRKGGSIGYVKTKSRKFPSVFPLAFVWCYLPMVNTIYLLFSS